MHLNPPRFRPVVALPVAIAVLIASRRLIRRPAVRLFVLGMVAVWLVSGLSFVCTRPLAHMTLMLAAKCPVAAHHEQGTGHDMPMDGDCAGQPCLDEVQAVDLFLGKVDAMQSVLVFALLWLWFSALESASVRGPPHRPPPRASVPLFLLFCILRN